ncbi:MAG: hypothetical protein HAW62_04890 [Endozoicomonadaceae bacterium]|nr:hypothetical protein [Endozoicomonadaceae bacterium]
MIPHSEPNNPSCDPITSLQDAIKKTIAESHKQLSQYAEIKEKLEYEPGLCQEGIQKNIIDAQTAETLLQEEKVWQNTLKQDVKQDIKNAKKQLKAEKKWIENPNTHNTHHQSRKLMMRKRMF